MGIANLKFKRQDGTYIPLYAAPPAQSILGLLGLGATSIKYLDQIFKGNINMFAKYKPVKKNSVSPDANFWKADNGDCGVLIPQLKSLSEIGVVNWSYDRPRGHNIVAGEYLRVRDFYYYGNYDRGAIPAISSGQMASIKYNKMRNADLEISIKYELGGASNSPYLGLRDFANFTNWYAAVCIGKSANVGRSQTATSTLMNTDGDVIRIDKSHLATFANGDYNIYYYLRSEPCNFNDPDGKAMLKPIYHGMGYLNPVPLRIVTESPFPPGSFVVTKVSRSQSIGFVDLPKTAATAISNTNGKLYFQLAINNSGYAEINIARAALTAVVFGYYGQQKVDVGMVDPPFRVPGGSSNTFTIWMSFSTRDAGPDGPAPTEPQMNFEASFDISLNSSIADVQICGDWFFMKNR